jgi:uncharacterized membrane protein YfcA
MPAQDYASHKNHLPVYQKVLFFLLLLTFIGSLVNVYQSLGDHQRIYSASLIMVLTLIVCVMLVTTRIHALKAQDRAIRAEENLRHFALTGKLLDPRLTLRQIIGLRFASDDEFAALARRAADEGLSEDAIKQAVKNWRPDFHRL